MWLRWFPWRFLLKRTARAHGFIDPLGLVARVSQFAQPSEVAMPLELLRLGVVFHARGVVNTQAISRISTGSDPTGCSDSTIHWIPRSCPVVSRSPT
jgi:hypothetical protein